ncbi:MAG: hypothetical protein WBN08_08900, partial [Thiogranum sp.]
IQSALSIDQQTLRTELRMTSLSASRAGKPLVSLSREDKVNGQRAGFKCFLRQYSCIWKANNISVYQNDMGEPNRFSTKSNASLPVKRVYAWIEMRIGSGCQTNRRG